MNISFGNNLARTGDRPLPEPNICRHMAPLSSNEVTHVIMAFYEITFVPNVTGHLDRSIYPMLE